MSKPNNHRISLAQINSYLTSIPKNIDHHLKQIETAISEKSDLIIFPELSLSGYNIQDAGFDIAVDADSEILDSLRKQSKYISILLGFPERGKHGEIFNSACLLENGEAGIVHRKRYLPTYNVFDESRFFTHGNSVEPCLTKIGRTGVLICEDSWHPGTAYLLAYQNIEQLIIMAASPYRSQLASETLDTMAKWNTICQSYAAMYQIPVYFVNRVGSEDGILFWGGSSAFKAGGYKFAEAPKFEEKLITVDCAKNEMMRDRYISTQFLDEDLQWQFAQMEKLIRNHKDA